ncbi:hypothetical protein [Streptomyces sp. LUP30]|uniref:hypothetical protein n=1 Tax=Streptomyces sp. LUP30 TaxID=1890285 RepID=UPI00114CDA8F|nr:hypothetical protein [Streptomyces sp. LUP30]
MENEHPVPQGQVVWGLRYFCNSCQGQNQPRDSEEAVQADAVAHRQQEHGGLEPRGVDGFEQAPIGWQAKPAETASSGGGAALVILVTLIIAVIVVAYIVKH